MPILGIWIILPVQHVFDAWSGFLLLIQHQLRQLHMKSDAIIQSSIRSKYKCLSLPRTAQEDCRSSRPSDMILKQQSHSTHSKMNRKIANSFGYPRSWKPCEHIVVAKVGPSSLISASVSRCGLQQQCNASLDLGHDWPVNTVAVSRYAISICHTVLLWSSGASRNLEKIFLCLK